MENIQIRMATLDDIESIAKIEQECFSMPWSYNAIEESMQKDYAYFVVAVFDGEIVGYIGMYKSFDEGDITNVAIKTLYRRKGIANRLLNYIFDICKNIGVERILLEVRESNAGAIALYENNGFENIGLRKNFYERPVENALILKKELS